MSGIDDTMMPLADNRKIGGLKTVTGGNYTSGDEDLTERKKTLENLVKKIAG